MSDFMSLVKNEPVDYDSSSTAESRIMNAPHPQSIPDPQVQATSVISQQTTGGTQGSVQHTRDGDLGPVPRGRANTWPSVVDIGKHLRCPLDDHQHSQDTTGAALGNGQTVILDGVNGAPKKNTSRRNPWGNMSYAELISRAIQTSPENRATLSQIYDWMVQNIPYFSDKGDSNSSAGWKNSIRHNLSLHNRFVRVQNEGTGKSSWWILNPDAKSGKVSRRRVNTIEGGRMCDKPSKRGRVKKKVDLQPLTNGFDTTSSPSNSNADAIDCYPDSPHAVHHPTYQLSTQEYRTRAHSNASSCNRLSPPPNAVDHVDMHDSQVPPTSPSGTGWGHADYWATGHPVPHGPYASYLGVLVQERYSDQLVESMGENLKLGSGSETQGGTGWVPSPHLSQQSPDGLKNAHSFSHTIQHHTGNSHEHHIPHLNGFLQSSHPNHQLTHFNSYEDFTNFGPHSAQATNYHHHLHHHPLHNPNIHQEKVPPCRQAYPMPSVPVQALSPAESLSPPTAMVESPFPPSGCESDLRHTPSFASPPPPPNSLNHPVSQTQPIHHTSSNSNHQSHSSPSLSKASSQSPLATQHRSSNSPRGHLQRQDQQNSPHSQQPTTTSASETATMLKVALSQRSNISGGQQNFQSLKPGASSAPSQNSDLSDLESIQGSSFIDCNIDEVIKHEQQYDEQLTFDFPDGHNAPIYGGQHLYSNNIYHHRETSSHQMVNGPSNSVQNYSRSSIAAGNHQWVR